MYSKMEKLLSDNKVSAYRVSKDLGLSPSMFSEWKSGRSEPKADKIVKICEYFNVPLTYFYGNGEETEKV